MKSKIFNIVALAAGIALLVGIIWHAGPATLAGHLASIGLNFLWIVLVYLAETLLEVRAWQLMVPKEHRAGYVRMFAVSQAGAAMNGLLPGQSGEVVKGTLLRGHMKTRWIVSSLLLYNFNFIATTLPVLLLCSGYLLISGDTSASVAWSLFAGVVISAALPTLLFIWIRRGVVGDVLAAVRRLPLVGRLIKDGIVAEGARIDHETRSVWKHRPADFVVSSVLLVLARFLAIFEVWLILYLIGKPVSPAIACGVYTASQVFGYMVMFLPTSFGVMEGGTKVIFQLFSLAGDVGLAMEVTRRLRKFFFMFIGLFCLAWLSLAGMRRGPVGQGTSGEPPDDERGDNQ